MKPSSKYKKILFLSLILLLPSMFYLLLYSGKHNYQKLLYYGPKTAIKTQAGKFDTIYHTIPNFKFINQDGKIVSNKTLAGNNYIADFFFATCPTICPKMATNMVYLQDKFKNRKNLRFLSITVNPTHDNVAVLKKYAKKIHANTNNWDFVTGKKDAIYNVAFKGFFVNVMKDSIAPGGFLHSSMLILVDKTGHIRGYFDGTVYKETKEKLSDAIDILFKEEIVPLKGKPIEKIEQKR